MKILLLTRYSRLGASSRLRTMQYVPFLESRGFSVEIAPLFDDAYLRNLYAGARSKAQTAALFWRRLKTIVTQRSAELLWLEYEALPWLPWPLERWALPHGIPLVTDYDDAVFHRYDLHKNPLIRATLSNKIDRIMAASQLVVAGNAYLAERARHAGAKRIEIIPTVVDAENYGMAPLPPADGKLRIGWIGSPSTWDEYIAPRAGLFQSISNGNNAIFRAVGAASEAKAEDWLEILPWSEETEVQLIQGMDVGLMPLTDTPWARGKCGYKLIQYMACGLPVVASPVGVNREIVEHGVNGFLAETETEWREALTTLLSNSELRERMGIAGRRKVEMQYSLQVQSPRLADLLAAIAARGKA
ncbi:glycosyltransferase family 4 protein [Sedimentimonas flavescens]|uniref:Glycosyltransferase family 4 protein n=1 Tax=Sedimentimonas flavescens TaxID=2851012 RepID=A0ABT2ZV90_9RHOB|nr:glycosyltransferase family 4 protein [Sedimentimonas flavescens]MCV2877668.1 glycosyltransferase family 4 protein [Sedimentimonas flavescens]